MSLAACIEHTPLHNFGKGYLCSRCGAPASPQRLTDIPVTLEPPLSLDRLDLSAGDALRTGRMTLVEMIGRLEKLPGACRPTDAAIFNLLVDDGGRIAFKVEDWSVEPGKRLSRYHDGWLVGQGVADKYAEDLPKFTASIDAAVALIERRDAKNCYRLEKMPPSGLGWPYWATAGLAGEQERGAGATPAIALCIAFVRSLEAARK